jgi:hypothetical protein
VEFILAIRTEMTQSVKINTRTLCKSRKGCGTPTAAPSKKEKAATRPESTHLQGLSERSDFCSDTVKSTPSLSVDAVCFWAVDFKSEISDFRGNGHAPRADCDAKNEEGFLVAALLGMTREVCGLEIGQRHFLGGEGMQHRARPLVSTVDFKSEI